MAEQMVIAGEKWLKESCDGMGHYQENTHSTALKQGVNEI